MAIVGGFDVHRQQITFNHVETETGEVHGGKISPATRVELRRWLEQFDGQPAAFAVEGCTGWRFVVEELQAAGIEAHLAEPADTAALRGPKKRAKTDQLRLPPPARAAVRRDHPRVVDPTCPRPRSPHPGSSLQVAR